MSVKTYTSLAWLNAGQAVIFTLGLTAAMAMSIAGIKSGANTVGDFVLINAMMIQLYQPLNFMGVVYREIRQSAIDIEMMFAILGQNPEIEDRPGAKPLVVTNGRLSFENVSFHYDPRRAILKDVSFRSAGRQDRGGRWPLGRRQINALALDFPFLRAVLRADHHRRSGYLDGDPGLVAGGDRHGSARYGSF